MFLAPRRDESQKKKKQSCYWNTMTKMMERKCRSATTADRNEREGDINSRARRDCAKRERVATNYAYEQRATGQYSLVPILSDTRKSKSTIIVSPLKAFLNKNYMPQILMLKNGDYVEKIFTRSDNLVNENVFIIEAKRSSRK
ncbi:unnamed protein product [Trichogramma brassicae]|uniref:Uncharacterized protein n=1 Tax=Trichogramma brassicae TaxID=86971 RepID=A0A6H5IPS4_9HYME|nr:unnamed protein product [Trichogramma brassicae]